MRGERTRPGVHVTELPSGVRSISGVPTSITAFVGRAARGPTNEPVLLTSFAEFERVHGGLWKDSTLGFAVRDFFRNGGRTAVVVRVYRADGAKPSKAALHLGAGDAELRLQAVHEGSWGNALRARVDIPTRPPDAPTDEDADSLFDLYVEDGTTGVVEEHRDVVVAPADHPRLVTSVLAAESRLVTAIGAGTKRPPATAAEVTGDGAASDGLAVTSVELAGPGAEATATGLFALDKVDVFNLLVVPPYQADGSVDRDVVRAAGTYCLRRRAMLLLDPPTGWTTPAAVSGPGGAADLRALLGTSSTNAAVYYPWLRQPDPLNDDQVETFPPAGAVAGVIARTDADRGVWKPPAGVSATLEGVAGLSRSMNDDEVGALNPHGVNALRTMRLSAPVVWGARTVAGADSLAGDWKYVSVRRTALFLEESVSRGVQWAVFEPNGEPLWSQLRLNVGGFLHGLFQQGAFQGTTPDEAYLVRCDQETTTQADIDRGVVNIQIGFAPLKPAEFVVVRIQQRAGQQVP